MSGMDTVVDASHVMNMWVQVFVHTPAISSSGYILRSEIAGTHGNSMWNLLRNHPWWFLCFCQSSLTTLCPFCFKPILGLTSILMPFLIVPCGFPWLVGPWPSCEWTPLVQLCLEKLGFGLLTSSVASALFGLVFRMLVPLPEPHCSLSRVEMDRCSLCSKVLGTNLAFLLLGYSSNHWRLQK